MQEEKLTGCVCLSSCGVASQGLPLGECEPRQWSGQTHILPCEMGRTIAGSISNFIRSLLCRHPLSGRKWLLESWRPSHLPAEAFEALPAASEKALVVTLEQLSIWVTGNPRTAPSSALSGLESPRPRLNCWGCPLEGHWFWSPGVEESGSFSSSSFF